MSDGHPMFARYLGKLGDRLGRVLFCEVHLSTHISLYVSVSEM
jgi:hypothetical protein